PPDAITIDATAAANPARSISKVEFYQNNNLIGQTTTPVTGNTYRINWSNVAVGNYVLTAKATDSAGAATTSAPVNIVMNPGPGSLLPVAHWRFDEADGTVAADYSGNGNSGTLLNGPVWTRGKMGHA